VGYSNKHIADLLGLSTGTIAGHLASAQAKLGAKSRREVMDLLGGSGSGGRIDASGPALTR
jgi:DNA-binding CsgD family transcriptional regulator